MRPVLGNHADPNGRASRSEYWWWIGALFGVYIVIAIVTSIPFTLGSILGLVLLLFMILDSEPTANQWGAPPLGSRYYVG